MLCPPGTSLRTLDMGNERAESELSEINPGAFKSKLDSKTKTTGFGYLSLECTSNLLEAVFFVIVNQNCVIPMVWLGFVNKLFQAVKEREIVGLQT